MKRVFSGLFLTTPSTGITAGIPKVLVFVSLGSNYSLNHPVLNGQIALFALKLSMYCALPQYHPFLVSLLQHGQQNLKILFCLVEKTTMFHVFKKKKI